VNQLTQLHRLLFKRQAYRRLLMDNQGNLLPDAAVVMQDLSVLCCAHNTTLRIGQGGIDPYATIYAEGRREVWLRIQKMLNIDDRALQRQLDGVTPMASTDDD